MTLLLLYSLLALAAEPWPEHLRKQIPSLEKTAQGKIGVYVKNLQDQTEFKHEADRSWYLASTVKVPVAIVLLQQVEKGAASLKQTITLQQSDFVDGMGEVLFKKPGEPLSLEYLLQQMLKHSDSSAADILIRFLGEEKINSEVQNMAPGFQPITTLLAVRKDAYSQLHPHAATLTNMDFIQFKSTKDYNERLNLFLNRLNLNRTSLRASSIAEAFERYYSQQKNSAPLSAFGQLLEKLVQGKLLNPTNTQKILSYMESMTTGEHRIKAGLPPSIRFAQKTGTQIARVCNMGILRTPTGASAIVAACVEKFPTEAKASLALKELGRELQKARLLAH